MTATSAAREQLKYALAGGIAEEALTCVRTVAAFGGERREVTRYIRCKINNIMLI